MTTVGELIQQLSQYQPGLPVAVATPDSDGDLTPHRFGLRISDDGESEERGDYVVLRGYDDEEWPTEELTPAPVNDEDDEEEEDE